MNRFRGVFRLPSWARRPGSEPTPEATPAVTEAQPPEATPASIAANERLQNRRRPSPPPQAERSEDEPEREEA